MDTLRGFVEAVWTHNSAIHRPYPGAGAFWSKPDDVSRNFELRRLTTAQNAAGIETDFFEFYWAHLMEGTSYGHVLAWARTLLFRAPGSVPRQLRPAYWLLWLIAIAAVALAVYSGYAKVADREVVPTWLSLLVSIALVPLGGYLVLRVIGDAARYLHVAPTNVQRRHEIRHAGVTLLKELHRPERGYGRIIIVGHSLGSVIGYDVLTTSWVDFYKQHTNGSREMGALNALEALAQNPDSPVPAMQTAQREYFEELKQNGNPWRVTDFVTLGSPLAHATMLLADDAKGLLQKQTDREFPCCLPILEEVQREHVKLKRFSFEAERPPKPDSYRVPHHAAVFGPTRWTNLFFPCHAIVYGDVVGGPLRGVMGTGIRDVPVSTRQGLGFLTHTKYWSRGSEKDGGHIEALRDALDLTDAAARWSGGR